MTRSDEVRQYIAKKNYEKALSIACRFSRKISKEAQQAMQRAHECYSNPKFYESLGLNCTELINIGIATLDALYHPTFGTMQSANTVKNEVNYKNFCSGQCAYIVYKGVLTYCSRYKLLLTANENCTDIGNAWHRLNKCVNDADKINRKSLRRSKIKD